MNYISNSINIIDICKTYIPSSIQKWNEFDELGNLVSLPRLKGEKNWEYRRRISDVFVHIANSTYQGLLYGITRELGLSLFNALVINPKTDSSGDFITQDPYIKFDESWLLLYRDYANDDLTWAIDRYQMGGNYETLGQLVDFINTTNEFDASLYTGIDRTTRSINIFNQTNRQFISREFVSASTKFKLKHDRLVVGTVFFSNPEIFTTLVNSAVLVNSKGKYYIDHRAGIITTYSIPGQYDYVRYTYTVYPFIPLGSPIVINDLNNDNFKVKMFEQILSNGDYIHGIPTELGTDIINELFSVYPMDWGV